MKKLGFFDQDVDPEQIVSGKTAKRDVWDLSKSEYKVFMDLLSGFINK